MIGWGPMSHRWGRAILGALLAGAGWAYGQPATYKCVDDAGRSTYTNVKEEMTGKKCAVVSREVSVVPAQPAAVGQPKPAPASASRNNDRRKILEEELSGEEKRLAEAREKLSAQEAQRSGDERNYQRVQERLKPFAEAVEQHEKNVAQLRRELNSSR
jgi:septal ring factor EnvC (AmiA/AmiB activator)